MRFWGVLVGVLVFPLLLATITGNRRNEKTESRRAENEEGKRAIDKAVLAAYIIGVLIITLGIRNFDNDSQVVLNPLRAYGMIIRSATDGFKRGGWRMMWKYISWYKGVAEGVGLNILLFAPLGYLLPRVMKVNWPRVLLFGFGFSLLIEVTQLVTHLGWFDTSDLLHNTLGSVLGFLYYKFLEKHPC